MPDAARRACYWIACGGGAGLIPGAPGTFGSLIAVALYLLVGELPLWIYLSGWLVVFLGATLCVHLCLSEFTSDDPEAVVIDEVAGALLAFTALPSGWLWLAAAFVLFRAFDILKPWPVCWFDRNVKGAAGIMLDDAVAGLYVVLIIHAIIKPGL